ncbi:class I SAM-dependent methyltransferase [Microvirga puerhi]|uniref:Class I SAM-dependent methyltransferase n=1 Tax=Microvirga puerhi TaxID=2876078 RepID=A0ABS7VGV1_9HYPH|nr:class I SAM-dependent methyltransferase [Microvirga puerhi]MBZ6074726.1 class I SAM-dependent methyltransferase [Microvirga puerhi]
MGRFASSAAFYERYRPIYPPAFFSTVSQTLGLDGSQRLIDLGTGPGLLAIGFAPFVTEIVGVDPEPAMLAAAGKAAARAGVRLNLIHATTENLPQDVGNFQLATIGRALHWMEPQATLQVFDRIIAPGGVIVIASSRPDTREEQNEWLPAYQEVRQRWTPPDAGESRNHDPKAFFAGSSFEPGETIEVAAQQSLSIDDLIGRTLSYSSSSPQRLGNKVGLMTEDLRRTLAPFASSGRIEETVVARATIFHRP